MNGYILVGGQSRRMGMNKSELIIADRNICDIIKEKLMIAGCSTIYLVGKTYRPSGIPQITESWTDYHPLYGVYTALSHCPENLCLITPCDIPYVSIESYKRLLCESATTILSTSSKKQPLLGIFSSSKREQALAYAQQQRSVMSFVESEPCIIIPDNELRNLNHPNDLRGFHDHR